MSYDTVLGGSINRSSIRDTGTFLERDEEEFFTFARRLNQDLRQEWPLKPFYDHKDKLAKKKTRAELEQAHREYKVKLRQRNTHFSQDYINKIAYRYTLELYIRDMNRDWSDQQVKVVVHNQFKDKLRKLEVKKQIKAEREGVRGFVGNTGAGIAGVGDRDGLAERTEALRTEHAERLGQLGGSFEGAAVVGSVAQAKQTNGVSKAAVAGPSSTQQPPPTSTGKQTTQVQHPSRVGISAGHNKLARAQEQILQGLRQPMELDEQKINRARHPILQIPPGLLHMERQSYPNKPFPGKVPGVQDYLRLVNRRRAAESSDGHAEFLGKARVGGEGGQSQGQVLQMQVHDQQQALYRGNGHTSTGEESESHGQGEGATGKQAQVPQRRNSQASKGSGNQSQSQASIKQLTEVHQLERTSRKRNIDGTVVQRPSPLRQDSVLTSPEVQVHPQFAQQGNSQAGEGSGNQAREQQTRHNQPTVQLASSFANETVQQQSSVPTNVQHQLQEYAARIKNQQRNQQFVRNGVGAQAQQRQFPSQQLQNARTTVRTSPVQRAPNFLQEQNTRNVSVNNSPGHQEQSVQHTNISVQQTQGQSGPRQDLPLQSSPIQHQFPPQQQAMQRQNSQNGYGVGIPTQHQVLQQSTPTQTKQFPSQHQAMQRHTLQNGYENFIPSPHQHTQQQLQQNAQMTALQSPPIQHQLPHSNFQQSINQRQFPVQPPSNNQNQNIIGNPIAAHVAQQMDFYQQPQLQQYQTSQNGQNTLVNGSQFQQQVIPPPQLLYQQSSAMQHQQLPQQNHRDQNVNAGGYVMSTPGFYTQQQHQQLSYVHVSGVSVLQQVPDQGYAGQIQGPQGEAWRVQGPHGPNRLNAQNGRR